MRRDLFFDRAKTLFEDCKTAKAIQGFVVIRKQPSSNVKWEKPSAERFKCNIDAIFSEDSNMVAIGMCIRDENGTFVLAITECSSPICEVHVGEALGLSYVLDD
jgi:hypothetical protein